MKCAAFSLPSDPSIRFGIVDGDRILEVSAPSSLMELIRQGSDGWRRMRALAQHSRRGHALSEVRLHAPMPRPAKNIVCLGRNYAAHAQEAARARGQEAKLPALPVFFTKAVTSVNGPFDDIVVDRSVTNQVDWEVELGVIIGKGGINIRRADALSHVFGYTVINDVSARDLQQQHHQFFKGKSLDGFCPIGPVVVTADEFGDPHTKRLACRVNGVTKQDGHTGNMIFPVDSIIEWLSKGLTLEPGDIIATGTPDGVGMARTPPEYLQDGDVMETEVEGIGVMRNRIRNA
jgi:2-keto-4-pentenoate hydratase/2-oxohepta-3-ene-1,7-dioic acid hydratase in catechol pathway